MLQEHKALFETVRNSAYFWYSIISSSDRSDAISENVVCDDSLVVSALADGVLASCPLLLIDRYGAAAPSPPSSPAGTASARWTCPNRRCGRENLGNVRRCAFCLTDPRPPAVHVLFVLHGFRVGEARSVPRRRPPRICGASCRC